jgi:hypothetical protein
MMNRFTTLLCDPAIALCQLIIEQFACRVMQFYFDWPIYYLKRIGDLFPHTAHDYFEMMDNLKIVRSVRYGKSRLERYNVMTPTSVDACRGVVFNVHGGGFVCSQDELYLPSMSAIARQGYIIVGIDYPT